MRILQIRFKNLNSLVGEWHIDLTDPAFTSDGIFAITGPTGAGKSTILDAMCLALYGRTPRLDKVTKSSNEIMSRQTGECFAEVGFATQTGHYRCHWSQRRARKKPGGELQSPKHEMSDADSGKVISSLIKGVAAQVELASGMNFDRFTRSMLLAQGGFAAFLQASENDRAPILEQITGTEIYSQLSIRVHDRQREEGNRLDKLQAETAGIVILEPEQEQTMREELAARQKQETELAAQASETGKAITWLTTIEHLKKEILSLDDEAARLKTDGEAFKPDRAKLAQADKAASLAGTYATLTTLRKQQADDQALLTTSQAELPAREATANTQAEVLKAAAQRSLKAKAEYQTAAPLIQQVRLLDQKMAAQTKTVSEGTEDCARQSARIKAGQQARIKQQDKRTTAEKTRTAAEHYLQAHAQDEWLIGGLAGVEEQCRNLLTGQQEITQQEARRKKADRAVADATKNREEADRQCSLKKQALETAGKAVQQGKDALHQRLDGKLLREYRTEKETLLREKVFLTTIAELEDHRAKLEDGTSCPLCGATEHPFAEGNVPVPDETEQKLASLTQLISQAEDQEATIKKREQAETTARKQLHDSEQLAAHASHNQQAAETRLAEIKNNLMACRAGFDQLRLAVSEKLQPLGITDIAESGVITLLESLKSSRKAWQEQTLQKANIEKQLATIDSELQRLDAVIDTQVKALAEKQEQLARLQKEQAAHQQERKALYGDKEPDEEEGRLNKAIADAEQAENKARTLNTEQQHTLTVAKARLASLHQRIEQRAAELKSADTNFSSALIPAGFADEAVFLAARLPHAQRELLSSRAKGLDDARTALKAKQNDRAARLAIENDKKITDQTLEALEPQRKAYEEALQASRDAIASLKHQLHENTAARERIKAKQTAIEAQKTECRRWDQLHTLIGAADGKKYRNFAQGLTFELMVSHANRQLAKMTDRYLLIRDKKQPLELNVIDNYQAGEIRSTKNLSGGESFIVSLTLALGLSKMASRKVRVDSLFLDEGFGTLDDEALETALETLSGLQQDGKLIGIISHVSALKERISTRIHITPTAGGRSSLSGPGCTGPD